MKTIKMTDDVLIGSHGYRKTQQSSKRHIGFGWIFVKTLMPPAMQGVHEIPVTEIGPTEHHDIDVSDHHVRNVKPTPKIVWYRR